MIFSSPGFSMNELIPSPFSEPPITMDGLPSRKAFEASRGASEILRGC